ncbi:MAG: S-adenosylmethionine:tRNA ribosyltransferase-isomerase [Flavobacteriales bacterium]|nr:S-adenosylmethionine:tRNA ribosyltransferase-isomerase [Flavobacteriales bacterium]
MHPRELSIFDFTYALPEERIAAQPLPQRDTSRLLVYREGHIADRSFRDLPGSIPPGALLVLNDTRVVHARVRFQRTTGAVLECMVLTPGDGRAIEQALLDGQRSQWWCMMGNAKRWKGETLTLERDGITLTAQRVEQRDGEHLIEFTWSTGAAFVDVLHRFGSVPLPPYMRREAMPEDDERYNTVFAVRDGSVAAPTASLHFSDNVLADLRSRDIRSAQVTLHVGAGTFLPVKSTMMADHAMHAEEIHIQRATIVALRDQLDTGPIIPVGTTALRTIESLYWHGVALLSGGAGNTMDVAQWDPYREAAEISSATALDAVLGSFKGQDALNGRTRLLIAPGYRFRMADALVTNFHQPQSTLLLLVAAFIGPGWREVYQHALDNGYRFLSYGDGSLLFRSS